MASSFPFAPVVGPSTSSIPLEPSTSTLSSPSAPLSPELVQSLRIQWLDLGLPRFTQTVTPHPPSSSSTSSSAQPSSASSTTGNGSGGSALEQDTLAMRRMKAAHARMRPPLFRRRSKSLDDVESVEAEEAAREMKELKEVADAEGAGAAAAAAAGGGMRFGEIKIDPYVKRDEGALGAGEAAGGRGLTPLTATSASSFATMSSATTAVPHSTTTSTFTAATTAPSLSPYTPCQAFPADVLASTSSVGLSTRSVSEPALAPQSLVTSAVDLPPASLHPPQPSSSVLNSNLTRSYSAHDSRLTTWVHSVSAASSLSSSPAPSPAPSTSALSPAPSAPSRLSFPLPPRQPYTPVLPSPLSTCSYTSDHDDDDGQARRTSADDGFPFPTAPAPPSHAGASGAISQASSSGASSPAAASTRSAPVVSPSSLRASLIGGGPGRPPLHSFGSASTIATASTSSTATAAPSPLAFPPSSAAATPEVVSPRPSRAASVSFLPTIPASSSSSLSSSARSAAPPSSSSPFSTRRPFPNGHVRSFSHSFATLSGPSSAPIQQQPSPSLSSSSAAAARQRAPSTSTSISSASALPFHTRTTSSASGRHNPPLTPPESLCTGPFLAGASASELAWHEVLGSKLGGFGGPPAAAAAPAMGSGSVGGSWGARNGAAGGGRATPDTVPAGLAGGGGGGAGEKDGEGERKAQGELMGNAAPGGFAQGTRERMQGMLEEFLGGVPVREGEGTVSVVEYGAGNSRSAQLVTPILTHFASRQQPSSSSLSPSSPISASSSDDDSLLSFQITHCDRPASDFRPLAQQAEDTYLRSQLAKDDRVFSTFAARPFGAKVVPKGSVSVGFSAMSLHWPSTSRKFRVAPATLAHGELMAFLAARATEFKPGGLLALAYIARSEEYAAAAASPSSLPSTPAGSPPPPPSSDSPSASNFTKPALGQTASAPAASMVTCAASSTPPASVQVRKKDIWAHMTSVLGKAIQRLVSTGLLKPQVARQLLALPLHSRTPRQTRASLQQSAHSWETLKSEIVVLSHPAWKGVEHGTVSPESWADHTIQLLRIFWEGEMRSILREALGSRGACEWVLDCLWTVAKEKLEELPPHPLELEVQLVALRRKSRSSVSAASASPVGAGGAALPAVPVV
ncbi:hypothetical protein JCM8547_005976 [Rhodosporidiobolus lusitaniae]